MKKILIYTFLVAVLSLGLAVPAMAAGGKTFIAHLSGGEEVPPVDNVAQGQAIFQLNKTGDALISRLISKT